MLRQPNERGAPRHGADPLPPPRRDVAARAERRLRVRGIGPLADVPLSDEPIVDGTLAGGAIASLPLCDVRSERELFLVPAPRVAPPHERASIARAAAAWIAPWSPAADLLVFLVVVFASVVVAEGTAAAAGATWATHLGSLLAMRVSITSALLVSVMLAWASTALRLTGAYDLARGASVRELVTNTVAGCTIACLPAWVLPWWGASGRPTTASTLVVWGGVLLGTAAVRVAARATLGLRRRLVRVVLVGTGPRAQALWRQLRADPLARYELVAVTDTAHALAAEALDDAPLADGHTTHTAHAARVAIDGFEAFLMHAVVDEVFVALPVRSHYAEIQTAVRVCERAGVHAHCLADIVHPTVARPRPEASGPFPAVAMHVVTDDWRLVVKRGVDVILAGAGLVLLSPVTVAVGIAVKLTSPGPVFFAQERLGRRKRRFRMYKFRTMVPDAERLLPLLEGHNEATGAAFKIRNDPRVTRLGRLLRRTSLDELPQLWNVLVGDMSVVGPRPMSLRDVSRLDEASLMRRFSVRPGLTCLWQVGGRSNLPFDQWMRLDLQYIDEWSLSLDAKIIGRTVPAVIRGDGAT